jgi:hypothetical protein
MITEPSKAVWRLLRMGEKDMVEYEITEMDVRGDGITYYGTIEFKEKAVYS